ncbi:hypothetical protein MKX01_000496 [Papaver californicum]|nr:hypothetical protein MKX01_000496 [Papaver californicum]
MITCAAFAVQIFLTPYENVFRALFLVNNAPAGDSSLDISVMDIFTPFYDSSMATPSENRTETSNRAKKMSQKSIKTMLAEMIPSSNRMKRTWMKMPPNRITSISAMSRLLLKNFASSHSMRPKWSSEQDHQILAVESEIENAPVIKNDKDLYAPIYRNLSTFRRSYELMEEILKVTFTEGEKPFFHDPIPEGIYASEGWFMKQMEENKKFVVQDPTKAHLFYLPFSSESIRYSSLDDRKTCSEENFIKLLSDYLDVIMAKYPFWNRTGGTDHSFTGCHDWAPIMTRPFMNGCIRAFCNSDVNDDFVLGKDVALAETLVLSKSDLLKDIGGKPPLERQTLAFFAGNIHGYLRPILLKF